MAFIERVHRNGRTYYYVTKGFRIHGGGWKKIRKYLGSARPDSLTIKNAIDEIERDTKALGIRSRSRFKYLDTIDGEALEDLKATFLKWYKQLDQTDRDNYLTDFLVRFTYNSNAIEGNRLSFRDTALILTEGILPAGTEHNDIIESMNSKDAFELLKGHRRGLNRTFLLKVHTELTKNTKCRVVGKFRSSDVGIFGSDWVPPSHKEIPELMSRFFIWFNNKKDRLHPVELGAMAHLKLAQIHPFVDGNGRTARMIMNWVLQSNGYPMFYIEVKEKKSYYEAIEAADRGDEKTYVRYIAKRIVAQFTFLRKDGTVRPHNDRKIIKKD
jgi:Fic family protein